MRKENVKTNETKDKKKRNIPKMILMYIAIAIVLYAVVSAVAPAGFMGGFF